MEDPNSSGAGGSATGSGPKACRACATSKAKCIFHPATTSATNGKCRRCNRLNKECVMQTPAVRKRQPRTVSRVEQLEEKLEGLVNMMQSPSQLLEGGMPIPPSHSHQPTPAQSAFYPLQQSTTPNSGVYSTSSPEVSTPGSSGYAESVKHQDGLLHMYRSKMSPQFPFVVISKRITASELAMERPFLYKAVIMVASFHDKATQIDMTKEIFRELSDRMITNGERTLDLLQGLVILMGWYHTHIAVGRRMVLMLHLAMTLIIDLGLSLNSMGRALISKTEWNLNAFPEDIPGKHDSTSDEQRAFLGVHFMRSVIAIFMRDSGGFQDDHDTIERSIKSLKMKAEYQTDEYLVALMQLKVLGEEIDSLLPRYSTNFSAGPTAPLSLCVKTLQTKLEVFRYKLPLHLQQNPYLLMYYHGLLAYLTETAFSIPLPSRQATLHACLTSTYSFFSFMFSIPAQEYYKLTYPTWIQLSYILTVLFKLSSFESTDWNTSHVRGVLDLSMIVEKLLDQFENIQAWWVQNIANGQGKSDGLLDRFIPKLRQAKEAFERKRALISGEILDALPPPQEEIDPLPVDDLMFGQLDEAFWQEIVADWNTLPPVT